jgi:NAD(P)-dependent dehydrogenase (short-subunit alcohol dehydrogenase family)
MPILERFSLKHKVALVTAGAGPLMGSSCSVALAEAGATVITASRSLERNKKYADDLRTRGLDVHGMEFDICDCDSIETLHDDFVARFGIPDILVNNAIARPSGVGTIEEVLPETLLTTAKSDLVGLVWMCKQFCAAMAERGSGSVINIASIYSMVGNDPNLYVDTEMKPPIAYPFVKGGVVNFTRALAAYYGKRAVRVNAISPGGYFPEAPEVFAQRYGQRCPLGRMMNHEDLQGAVVFLASEASQYVTGANLVVDGGWTAI